MLAIKAGHAMPCHIASYMLHCPMLPQAIPPPAHTIEDVPHYVTQHGERQVRLADGTHEGKLHLIDLAGSEARNYSERPL